MSHTSSPWCVDMAADHSFGPAAWETTYQHAGARRLWPQEPTIAALDFDFWRAQQFCTVLDAGCGDGKNLAHLIRQGFFPIGIDASLSALMKCRQYLQDQSLVGNHLLMAPNPLDKLPLLDDSVDAAICVDVLGHLEAPLPILHELARIVRPGGCVYGSLFHVDDGCRIGPRMRPASGRNQFWYSASGTLDIEHYFCFYDESEARKLFNSLSLRLISLDSRRWQEPPHPGYRDEWHEHVSWFALLQKVR
jgi:SAM-dependent methyltransferase